MPTIAAEKTDLKKLAARLRVNIIRMIEAAGSGHPGGSLSIIDILLFLYTQVLRHDPKNPHSPDRDRIILSKGHACPALYAVMAHCGYFPESELMTLRKLGSRLQGHPDRLRLPGIEASTGSLGQGLSIALGMALAGLMDKKDYRVYAILGDGEMQEGQVWEALMAAPKFKTGNLTVIVDANNGQIDGHVTEIMNLDPLAEKLASFGWDVKTIALSRRIARPRANPGPSSRAPSKARASPSWKIKSPGTAKPPTRKKPTRPWPSFLRTPPKYAQSDTRSLWRRAPGTGRNKPRRGGVGR